MNNERVEFYTELVWNKASKSKMSISFVLLPNQLGSQFV